MRTIKLRFWNTAAKEWQTKYCGVTSEGKNLSIRGNGDYTLVPEAELIVMQFTGLLDKNGVEIYEGDLVNIDGVAVEVMYYNGSPVVKDYFKGRNYDYLSTFDETDVEIIGNKYEHPHLIGSN